jgi:hypothetical protein
MPGGANAVSCLDHARRAPQMAETFAGLLLAHPALLD